MLDAAVTQYRLQKALTARAAREATAVWAQIDQSALTASWQALLPALVLTVTAAQLVAAGQADRYVTAALREQDIDPDAAATAVPRAFAGVASDGRDLAALLAEPVIAAKVALARGARQQDALASGLARLVRIVGTQVADAGRGAESVATVARPRAQGYVRMLQLPSCSRCALLAGRFYRWSAGFQRHPLCDCRHVPTTELGAGDLTTDPLEAVRSGRVTGISTADRRAIDDGADIGRVLNARRGMTTADAGGRQVKATTARAGRTVRLRPEEVYRQAAGNRPEAVRLLRRFGYLA